MHPSSPIPNNIVFPVVPVQLDTLTVPPADTSSDKQLLRLRLPWTDCHTLLLDDNEPHYQPLVCACGGAPALPKHCSGTFCRLLDHPGTLPVWKCMQMLHFSMKDIAENERCHIKLIYIQNQSDPQIGLTSGCSWVSRNTLDFVDNYFCGYIK